VVGRFGAECHSRGATEVYRTGFNTGKRCTIRASKRAANVADKIMRRLDQAIRRLVEIGLKAKK